VERKRFSLPVTSVSNYSGKSENSRRNRAEQCHCDVFVTASNTPVSVTSSKNVTLRVPILPLRETGVRKEERQKQCVPGFGKAPRPYLMIVVIAEAVIEMPMVISACCVRSSRVSQTNGASTYALARCTQ
jgi:hypothetical protein